MNTQNMKSPKQIMMAELDALNDMVYPDNIPLVARQAMEFAAVKAISDKYHWVLKQWAQAGVIWPDEIEE